jgi:exo-1,4-beta-D-glucosaminidase
MRNNRKRLIVTVLLALVSPVMATPHHITLNSNWLLRSSADVASYGAALSTESFVPNGWYKASVPSSVLGTLVADGVYKDVFKGRNLDTIPDSLFQNPWWYRTVFHLPKKSAAANHAILKFLGVNYRADIWLNGHLIADSDSVVGGFRQFEFDVTRFAVFGGTNVLAVKVYRPGPGAVTLGFVDWNPRPPDHDMGLWRPVEVQLSGDVSIDNPFVATRVDTATLKKAELTVSAEVMNLSPRGVSGTLRGNIGNVSFSQHMTLLPNERRTVVFSPASNTQLVFMNPKLWWTHDFGKPNLYSLHLEFTADGVVSDYIDLKFGIRQIDDYINPQGFRGFKLNGRKILIRGGGWADQMFLEQNRNKLRDQIDYAVNMHLNALRLEGFWGENDDLYKLCDENGILIMVGWSALWEWKPYFGKDVDEFGGLKSASDMELAAESFKDEIIWLRNHPSIFVWVYGSDKLPRPELETKYQSILAHYDSTRPFLGSAAEHVSTLTGPTAVKMRGPYDYVPPNYWFADTSYGGAFGFNTETGPGPQVPMLGSLKKMLSPDSLWPINSQWNYHCSRGEFGNLRRYNAAITGRLGEPNSIEDYERKAQYTSYETMRAMFEAFGALKFKSTGVIQWMYNTAWPKMWWQLYDYYLNPTGAFYGAQEACRPLHAVYDCADHKVYIVNSTLQAAKGLKLKVQVFNLGLKKIYEVDSAVDAPSNTSVVAIDVPGLSSLSETYFADLRLYDNGSLIDDNFYALSRKPDLLDWKNSTWYVTPDTSYADLTGLASLPEVKLAGKSQFVRKKASYDVDVTLHNPTDHLAFMVYLSVRKGPVGDAVLPVFWKSNYITLLPGETRTITGHFHAKDLDGTAPVVRVSGWNVNQSLVAK